jgi:hypothetical protein
MSETDEDCELVNDDMRVSRSLFDATRERDINWVHETHVDTHRAGPALP